MKRFTFAALALLLVGVGATRILSAPQGVSSSAQETAKQPVFIYLYARITDHVNMDLSEDRLRHLLPMIEKFRHDHPSAHVSATILFSGAVSQALADRNTQTHIVDFVLDYGRRGVVEFGYDGTDEPTYRDRPILDFSNAKSIDDRWLVRETLAGHVLTEARDPLTGKPLQGKPGGLKEMQSVFGKAACIAGAELSFKRTDYPLSPRSATTPPAANSQPPAPNFAPRLVIPARPSSVESVVPEVGTDSETVREIRRYDDTEIMFGLPDTNVANLGGLRDAEETFAKAVSPEPRTSPELYWQDDVLRTGEASSGLIRLVHASDGPAALQTMLGKMSRTNIQILHVELGNEADYVQPAVSKVANYPLIYAYGHVDHPDLPAEARRSSADVDAAYGRQAELLNWLVKDYFPGNPGSRFVSSADLKKMAAPDTGFSISVADLQAALAKQLDILGRDTNFFGILDVDHHYLSMANMYQVTADALAGLGRTGKLPVSVDVVPVYGPMYTYTGHGPNTGQVTIAELERYCEGIAPKLHDTTDTPVPHNVIPPSATLGGVAIASAQVLRLMSEAMVHPTPDSKFDIKMTFSLPSFGISFPKSRPPDEVGGIWTIKPAVLDLAKLGSN